MPAAKNSSFSVSPVFYPLPGWRYAVLFQSWGQLLHYVAMVLTVTVAIHGLAVVSGVRRMPIAMLLGGLAVGGLLSVLMVLRARFTVTPASEDAVRRVVTEVECARYVENGVVGNAVMYRQNVPRVLRWDEGNISVAREGDVLVISGPVMNLKRIRARLAA